MDKWISVEDRLPEKRNRWNSSWWMVSATGRIPFTAWYSREYEQWCDDAGKFISDITHWMPLPAPPESE